MSGFPPGADRVLSAGPSLSTTYGTGSTATTPTSRIETNSDTSSTTVRGRKPRSGGATGPPADGCGRAGAPVTSGDTRPPLHLVGAPHGPPSGQGTPGRCAVRERAPRPGRGGGPAPYRGGGRTGLGGGPG